ncbi:MAG: glycosyltransferase family 4 protein [Methylomonas sp.]
MRVLVLSRYSRLGASSRLRIYQYVPFLEAAGIQVTVAPLLDDQYINDLYTGKRKSLIKILKAYFDRLLWIRRAKDYDVVWLEKEFLPWLPAWLELAMLPKQVRLVADYDDAIFHQYDKHPSVIVRELLGKKINAVMRRADIVVAGNTYLANRARQTGTKRVEIVPTVVDTSRYASTAKSDADAVTVGWIGSPATAHFLHSIAPALNEIAKNKNVRFVAVGANADQLSGLPVSAEPWTETHEIEQIQQFDIGIMPLPDEPFERGKCGYKLIQCMACSKPVVASPVGANSEIVRDGIYGFWATSQADWITALTKLIDDSSLRFRLGCAGRARVETLYSLQVAAPKMESLFRSLMESPD